MSDEIPIAPLIYDGLDPAPKLKPIVSEVIEVLEETARHRHAIDMHAYRVSFDLRVVFGKPTDHIRL